MRYCYSLTVGVALGAVMLLACGCGYSPSSGDGIFDYLLGSSATDTQKTVVDPAFEATAGAKAIATGDINGDGLTDIVSISSDSQPVQIHLRRPLGLGFDTYTIAGGAPISQAVDVKVADLNGDGKLDIIVLVNDTGFAPPANTSKAGAVVMLFQGADPRNPADWTQIPAAGVSPLPSLTLASDDVGATEMAVGEFDGVNGPDIVVLSNEPDAHRVRLFQNPGPAEAMDPTAWQSSVIDQDLVGVTLKQVRMTDLDRDGDLDLVMSAPEAKSFNLRWLQNPLVQLTTDNSQPAPTFVPDTVDPRLEVTAGAKAIAIGDIDGDGTTDLASISYESQPVQIHLRSPLTGKFETISIAGGAPLAIMQTIALADFNGDGKLDIAVLVTNTSYVTLDAWQQDQLGAVVLLIQGANPRNPSDWTQVDAFSQPIPCFVDFPPPECDLAVSTSSVGLTDMAVADFTNDGLPDIAILANKRDKTGSGQKFVYLYPNPGPSNVTDPAKWHHQTVDIQATDLMRILAADVDEDGSQDMIVTMPRGMSFNIMWQRNIANGTLWHREFLAQQQGGADQIAVGDINGDGHLDLAAASVADSLVQWFENPGPAALAIGQAQVPWHVYDVGTVDGTISQVQLIDLDGNGKLDAFVTTDSVGMGFRPEANIYHAWDPFTIFTSSPTATIGQVAFSDFDGDGRIDFVAPFNRTGIENDQFVLYRSTAASLWHRRLIGQQANGAQAIAVGDIDGDGNDDVATAATTPTAVQWLRNPGPTALLLTAPQVPWYVFNLGQLESGTINQIQLVDLDRNNHAGRLRDRRWRRLRVLPRIQCVRRVDRIGHVQDRSHRRDQPGRLPGSHRERPARCHRPCGSRRRDQRPDRRLRTMIRSITCCPISAPAPRDTGTAGRCWTRLPGSAR